MHDDAEAVVFSLVKTLKGRGMLSLFTDKHGKISAGAFLRERGGAAAALRPFTYGSYEIKRLQSGFHIIKGEVISSFYALGEDVDRYVNAAYALEFTDKLLPEEAPAPGLFALLLEFLRMMEKRTREFDTPVLAYMLKALRLWGAAPELDSCAACGEPTPSPAWFSVAEGGVLCGGCAAEEARALDSGRDKLLYKTNFDIINVMKYLLEHPMGRFKGLAMDADVARTLRRLLRGHISYHLDIPRLKTESLLDGAFPDES
ncbi:MAG: DNA repair protein RecO [Clostridiales Family XIII bacterium]|jgi:DNA repair protein RecO (recombination protein O)|nr:DNA repair protein RecO [Clostridiales Family XIII bacterium]